jgi:hypothetical protein
MRASDKDCRTVTKLIEISAKQLGLIPPAAELWFVPGKGSYTPEVRVYETSDRKLTMQVSFLPTFYRGYKTTSTEAWLLLTATRDALAAVVNLKGGL